MKITLSFLAVATLIVASSCSSAYKTAQTPDDVYYSPAGQKTRTVSSDDQPEYYSTNSPSDQYIQLKTEDQARWSYFDDYNYYDSYYYSPIGAPYSSYYGTGYGYYGAGLGFGFGGNPFLNPTSYWSSYYAWNCFYNPYFYNPYYGGGMIVMNPKYGGYPAGYSGTGYTGYTPYTTAYSGLRTFSPASYRPLRINSNSSNNSNRYYTPGASRSNNGYNSFYRGANQNNNNVNNNNNFNRSNNNYQQPSQPVRSFTPSSGGGGSGGGVSRPGRF